MVHRHAGKGLLTAIYTTRVNAPIRHCGSSLKEGCFTVALCHANVGLLLLIGWKLDIKQYFDSDGVEKMLLKVLNFLQFIQMITRISVKLVFSVTFRHCGTTQAFIAGSFLLFAAHKPPPPPPCPGLRSGLHTLVHACLDLPTFTLSLSADSGVALFLISTRTRLL